VLLAKSAMISASVFSSEQDVKSEVAINATNKVKNNFFMIIIIL
jgi:hypothetical protein